MGDKRRFEMLSKFILDTYPSVRSIADVAGGQGMLSLHLAVAGLTPTVIDPRATCLVKRDRRRQRRGELPTFDRRQQLFSAGDVQEFDLIVGLHPDGATAEIASCADHRPCIIVPCCNYGWGVVGDPADHVRRFWTECGIAWREAVLPMGGRNQVLYTV